MVVTGRCHPFSPPGTCLYFLSRIEFGMPTARRFSSNVAQSCSHLSSISRPKHIADFAEVFFCGTRRKQSCEYMSYRVAFKQTHPITACCSSRRSTSITLTGIYYSRSPDGLNRSENVEPKSSTPIVYVSRGVRVR